MKAYSIFDDFDKDAIDILENAGVDLTIHPLGVPRPDDSRMKSILEEYDCVIIGTSQKIKPEMFENIDSERIIATASVGLDHIAVPENKKSKVKIFNTPKANARSVAEYTIGVILNSIKRISEGCELYASGKNNKSLTKKPEDIYGKTVGVIGAGNISVMIMEYARMLGMKVIYWTAHPEKHKMDADFQYMPLEELAAKADVISVNLPNNDGTKNLISGELVGKMKKDCIFVSVSRLQTIDLEALVERAQAEDAFYVNVDVDLDDKVVDLLKGRKHVYVTPHIGGGTVETRKRMFAEVSSQIADYVRK